MANHVDFCDSEPEVIVSKAIFLEEIAFWMDDS